MYWHGESPPFLHAQACVCGFLFYFYFYFFIFSMWCDLANARLFLTHKVGGLGRVVRLILCIRQLHQPTRERASIRMCVRVCVCVCIYMYICIHIYAAWVGGRIRTQYIYTYMCVCMCVHIYSVRVYMYTLLLLHSVKGAEGSVMSWSNVVGLFWHYSRSLLTL